MRVSRGKLCWKRASGRECGFWMWARGRGLSRRLLAALEDAARGMGYVVLRLETAHRQPEAIRLYESAGYRRIEPFGIYAGSQRSVCFEKRLT